jgi:tetratricopeptide (TPR) repeat protein
MDHAVDRTSRAATLTASDKFSRAFELHKAGQLAAARAIYMEIIAATPRHFGALHLCGVIEGQQGNYQHAIALLSRAIKVEPHNAAAYRNRALALKGVSRFGEALADYDRIIALLPDDAIAYRQSGDMLRALGRPEDALARYRKALALNPGLAEAHYGVSGIQAERGQKEAALVSLDLALRANAHYPEAHNNRGTLLASMGSFEQALASYQRAINANPNYAEAYFNRGLALLALQRFGSALHDFDAALKSLSSMPELHLNRSAALLGLGRMQESLRSLQSALSLQPDYAEAYYNRGQVLLESGRDDEALEDYERAIKLKPDYVDALVNSAFILGNRQQLAAALERYDRAIGANGNAADLHFKKANLLLRSGDFSAGWAEYEWRWEYRRASASLVGDKQLGMPLWLGTESLDGKTILLHDEQGLGDAIHFCRYARLVAQAGAQVILAVRESLVLLMRGLEGVSQVIANDSALPECDFHCPLGSLPLAFNTTIETIPAQVPYMQVDAAKLAHWRATLGESNRLRVGLVWSGGLRVEESEKWLNQRRNIPLATFAGLCNPDVEFYSLQKGEPAESELRDLLAADWSGPPIIDFTANLHDLSDTAALIQALDLVICVDTSIAHLAGALAKEVWILNRFDTEWRWLLQRTDSPWYPSARIYRQHKPGDWEDVLQRVARDLRERCGHG